MIKLFKLGSELTAQEQRYVLRHYVDRYTGEHTPAWRTTHSMQFANDADWLAHTRFAAITDQAETLIAVAEGCANVREIDARLVSLFADTEPGSKPCVVLSTVHKAKGLEWDRIFVLSKTFRKSGDEESNVYYVALTRTKNFLTFVN